MILKVEINFTLSIRSAKQKTENLLSEFQKLSYKKKRKRFLFFFLSFSLSWKPKYKNVCLLFYTCDDKISIFTTSLHVSRRYKWILSSFLLRTELWYGVAKSMESEYGKGKNGDHFPHFLTFFPFLCFYFIYKRNKIAKFHDWLLLLSV